MRAYVAAFQLGLKQAWRDKPELVSGVIVYTTLLTIFWTVYAIMPIDELGVPGLQSRHLFWYFVVTESITVSGPGLALFGRQIRSGRLSEFMQRPCSVLGFVLAWVGGLHLVMAFMLISGALILLPAIFSIPLPMPLYLLPLLAISMILGILLMAVLSFSLSTAEVLGPYSHPLSWIISKLVFAFGGLFFPVCYFPPLMRSAALLTPFPSVIFMPGQFMLTQDLSVLLGGIAQQVLWLGVMTSVAMLCQHRMLRHVLKAGD